MKGLQTTGRVDADNVKERGRAGVAGNSFQGIAQEMLGGVAAANLRKVRRFA
jgi:hypothetical protein